MIFFKHSFSVMNYFVYKQKMTRTSYNEVDINGNDLIVSQSLVIPNTSIPIANLTGGICFNSSLDTINLQCNNDIKRILHPDNVNIDIATIQHLTGTNLDFTSGNIDNLNFINSTGTNATITNLNVNSLTGFTLDFTSGNIDNFNFINLTGINGNIENFNFSYATGTNLYSSKIKIAGVGLPQENLDVNGNILVKGGSSSIYFNSTNTLNNYMRIFNIDSGIYLGSYWDWNGGNLNFRNGLNGVNALTLTVSGDLTLSNGLFLPTVGGTGSRLDYYETLSANHAFGFTTNSGTNQTVSVKFTRIGNKVIIQIPQFLVNCGNQSRTSIPNLVAIPARFRPLSRICQPVIMFFGGTSGGQTFMSMLEVQTTGIIDFYRDLAKTQFQLTSCGPKDHIVITYLIA